MSHIMRAQKLLTRHKLRIRNKRFFSENKLQPVVVWIWISFLKNLFNWRLITLQYCIGFAIHQHESATGDMNILTVGLVLLDNVSGEKTWTHPSIFHYIWGLNLNQKFCWFAFKIDLSDHFNFFPINKG